ncbi:MULTISPECIES: LLM class F420-dependent oxidoreductase [Streptomyces]|uniref:LLM class F420-dependent oxidoreductase n=1 Tax=Streptomyces thermoviolaceus subsp. thermoviolaceus TaxID=66860 RepID=A0ABX0Z0T9_STRTL|nr:MULTISPECIES: LLM class F420-dependent oxidoreductase [Streptomyces]MCM3265664.1 LLM class F420-dependent oxidoreductase [Streptomyces thermoviolaceus]NJP16835.1 LLM class F420-dependent oxidoreductase [Streptomyces thermoviolaceus subsp. thermoviolaceus]RSS00765.1 LLM class F420-dependent oxidoreductase [Streptomyces sp. WAC00469]WTD49086.1 LLM class F420-dependent oxidoreductase [Streptomyces thermoviolaceus]GGV73749.1 LLM class F420-dependent oxidoreductase [Streptomyces thermoviolaceus 
MSDTPASVKEQVGRYGIWNVGLRSEDPARRGAIAEAAAELEELGFGAVWLGGNSATRHATPLLQATKRLVVGTSIQSIWDYTAEDSAAGYAEVEAAHPGRFVLGLGVSHAKLAEQYRRPYSAMVAYLDALDAAGVPVERRVLAALGPKMLQLSRDRAAGTIPYLVTPEHTARAREILGSGPLLAPEFKVVLEEDAERARTVARGYLAMYLQLPNYTSNFLRLGFTEDDVRGGGSDRLIDAVFAWGSESRIRERIEEFRAAGADHVVVQVVTDAEDQDALPVQEWRRLAALLA